MAFKRKKPENDLRQYYILFLEAGLIVVLLFTIAVMKIDLQNSDPQSLMTNEQELVEMEDIIQTEQIEKPPPPLRPPVPVEVPNDEVIEDEILNIDMELRLDESLDIPPPPEEEEEEENFFRIVEQEPQLIGGMEGLHDCIDYPPMALRANLEGRVTIQMIVNEKGEVETPKVLRGIGGGADEEALRCIKKAEFIPGRQRGIPVRVQFSVPVVFRLTH